MEDYVVPEFYDVMVGGIDADGSTGGEGGNVATSYGTASWDTNGVTGQGWELSAADPIEEKFFKVNVHADTDEEIRNKISDFLITYGNIDVVRRGCQ